MEVSMSRPTTLSYPLVSKICLALIASGETPTVKKIQKQSGGSFSTVGKYYQQWQQEQSLAAKTETELSEPFRQAILAEFSRVSDRVEEGLKRQLADTQVQLKEAQEIIAEYESKVEHISQAFEDYQAQAEERGLRLEKELSATQALLEATKQREAACMAQFEALRQQCHQSALQAASLEAKLAEIEKYNHRLESELKTLQARSEASART
jgi:chromosome segregation ATPase